MIVETDNRYPEIARPYEPVKGARHYKRLGFPFALAGLFLISLPMITKPEPAEILPDPVVDPGIPDPGPAEPVKPADPLPSPEPSPVPTYVPYRPPVRPVPSPRPTEEPVPSPVPSVIPSPSPRPSPKPSDEPEDDVTVEIRGNTGTFAYAGETFGVEGFTYTVYVNGEEASADLFTVEYIGSDGIPVPYVTGTDAGTYEMGLTEESFNVSSDTYDLYGVIVEDGWLRIVGEDETATVYITGNTGTFTYDGNEHSVEGYTFRATDDNGDADSTLFTVTLNGTARATATDAGTYPLNNDVSVLNADSFTVTSDVYTSIDVVFENGWLEILKKEVTVGITGNTGTVMYDGQVHIVEGYTLDIPADSGLSPNDILHPVSEVATAYGTEPDTYYMNLQPGYFSCLNDNYDVTFTVVSDGWLKIVEEKTALVTITVNSAPSAYVYDGEVHAVHGYTFTAADGSGNAIDSSLITITMDTPSKAGVEGINAGTYTTDVTASDFHVTVNGYDSVDVTVVQGSLTITPAPLTVSIYGWTQTVPFDGSEHSVAGYTVDIPKGALIETGEIIGPASAAATGTEPGTYYMGLSAGMFSEDNDNYDVTFEVTDGWLMITPPSTEHIPPTVVISDEVSILGPSGSKDVWVGFRITDWNDLSDGQLRATLSVVDDDGANITLINGGTVTISGGTDTPHYEELRFHADYLGTQTPVIRVNISLEYLYSDGTSGEGEIGPAVIRTGSFAWLDTDYGTDGATVDDAGPIFDLIIDSSVDMMDVGVEYSDLTVNGNYVSGRPLMNRYTDGQGRQHIQLAYVTPVTDFPAEVSWYAVLTYDDGSGTVWTPSVSYNGTVNN